jgi:16S rRNA (cytosine967-C5)-methyltransferase
LIPGLPARQAATALLAAVLDDRRPFDSLFDARSGLPAFARLEDQDRALARAIATTALRRHGQIGAALDGLIPRKLPKRAGILPHILAGAAAQILFMEVADHAAVSLAVEQASGDPDARHFKDLANAVLRRLARERTAILAQQDAARLNTPDWLWQRWTTTYGATEARRIAEAHLGEPPLDLSIRDDPAGWAERLGGALLPTGTVRLAARGRIEALDGFAEGAWWVQDCAAALPARLFASPAAGQPLAGRTALDLCAAPGGKTIQLALMGAAVTAVDLAPARLARLEDNLRRLGLAAETVAADALSFAPERRFDAVLLDAPCSATGTIRRHPDIPWLKSDADVSALGDLQAKLLDRAAALTAPGGTLVYATCSLEPAEGEEQVRAALQRLPLELIPVGPGDVPGLPGECLRDGMLRTRPCDDPGAPGGMDGFFAARLRRL